MEHHNKAKRNAVVLEEVVTNIPNFIASLIYFTYSNTSTMILTLFTNWTIILRHPISTFFKLLFIPFISFFMLFLGCLFYFGRLLHVDRVINQVSREAYGGRSIANWGQVDVITDPEVGEGLELITSLEPGEASRFKEKIAKALLFLSSVVYEDEVDFVKFLRQQEKTWRNVKLKNIPGRVYCKDHDSAVGNFAALFELYNTKTKETAIVIGFRGTSPLDLNQWLLDCSMRKVDAHDYVYGAVHEGFYRTLFRKRRNATQNFYQTLVNDIDRIIKKGKLEDSNCRLWTTGHSLGGALASLFFARATKTREIKGVQIGDSYTFGSPHVGNLEFRSQCIPQLLLSHYLVDLLFVISYDNEPYYNTARLYRVCNVNDPVSRIPFGFDDPNILAISKGPSGLDSMDYIHVGVPILLHQHPYKLPSKPDFIVETPKDLAIYCYHSLIASSRVSNILDFAYGWGNVFREFAIFLKERSFASGAKAAVVALETAAVVVNHAPSTYCRNLSIRAAYHLGAQ